MKLGITLAGWIAFLTAIVGILVFRAENHRLAARVAEVEDSLDTQMIDTEEEALVPKEPPTAPYQTTDEYKDRAEKAEAALEELKALNASLAQKTEEAQRIDEKKETPKTRGRKDLSEFSEERQARIIEAERRARAVGAEMEVQRRYGLFLSNLDESIATQARAILSGIPPRSEWDRPGDYDQRIRDAMAEILSPGEMQAFEEYEDELPEILLRQDYDAQIARMAPGLSLESRNLVVDALIEEALYAADGAIESRFEDLAAYIDTMIAARDRLHETLPEDELPAATRYLDMRISAMGARLPFREIREEAATEDTPKSATMF